MDSLQSRIVISLSMLVCMVQLSAQCSGGVDDGPISPAPSSTWQTMTMAAGNFYTFVVPSGLCAAYSFATCSNGGAASFDTQLTILNNSGVDVGYNDDACSTLQSEILNWTAPASGTYRLFLTEYSCNPSGQTATVAYMEVGPQSSASDDFLLQGDAVDASTTDCIQLTANSTGQVGCTWDANSTLDFTSDFTYDFTLNLGANDGGADGAAFVIQNDPQGLCACGGSGQGFAASGIQNSLIIEIDTYLNSEDRDDGAEMSAVGVACTGGPGPDHLDIWLNGQVNPSGSGCPGSPGARVIPSAIPTMLGGSMYNVENGNNHIMRVTWIAASGTITANLMDESALLIYATVSYTFDPIVVFGTNTPYFGATAATGGLSNQQMFCNDPVLLPIKLIEFEVQCISGSSLINWTTISEIDNDYFTVLRSADGVDFFPIGIVAGSGNSSSAISYQFEDRNPLDGEVYYTMSHTDVHGITEESGHVRVVNCEVAQHEVLLYPNPSLSGESIRIFLPIKQDAEIRGYDAYGSLVFSGFYTSDDEVLIDEQLVPGAYHILIDYKRGKQLENMTLVVTRQ